MPVICRPPPSGDLIVWPRATAGISALSPRLILPDEVGSTNASLKVLVRWHILIVGTWRHIVRETDSVVGVFEVHVEQSLVGAIKRDAALCHSMKCPVVAHVWLQHHETRIEKVRPSDIRCGREWRLKIEQLIWCSPSYHIGIHIDYAAELGLFPELNLCEGGVEVDTIHEGEVRWRAVDDAVDWDNIVVYLLHNVRSKSKARMEPNLRGAHQLHPPIRCRSSLRRRACVWLPHLSKSVQAPEHLSAS